jgi:hypothetical protein
VVVCYTATGTYNTSGISNEESSSPSKSHSKREAENIQPIKI